MKIYTRELGIPLLCIFLISVFFLPLIEGLQTMFFLLPGIQNILPIFLIGGEFFEFERSCIQATFPFTEFPAIGRNQNVDRNFRNPSVKIFQNGMEEILGDIWVTEAGEIYMPVLVENVGQVLKLEDGAWTELMSLEGENVTVPIILDGIVVFKEQKGDTRWVHILTLSGETMYEGALYPEAIPGIEEDPDTLSWAIMGGDREKLILYLESWTEEYIVMLDLTDNLKPTVLWSDTVNA